MKTSNTVFERLGRMMLSLVIITSSAMVGCRGKNHRSESTISEGQKSVPSEAAKTEGRENRLLFLVGPATNFTMEEKSALKSLGSLYRGLIIKKHIVGINENGSLLSADFEKYELPKLIKSSSPTNRQKIDEIGRVVVQAVIYGYQIHRKSVQNEKWNEDAKLHGLLRFTPSQASKDTQYVLDHILMVLDDLDDLCR